MSKVVEFVFGQRHGLSLVNKMRWNIHKFERTYVQVYVRKKSQKSQTVFKI